MAFFLLALLLFTTGCPRSIDETVKNKPTSLNTDRSAGAFAQTDPWLLTTTDPNANRGNHGIFLGNGYLGATFGPDGLSGKDTVCYVAGAYTEPGEVLAGLPVWNTLNLRSKLLEGRYSQTLDMRRGLLVTRRDKATITAFLCRDRPHVAVLRGENLPNIQGDEEVRPDIVNPVNVFVYTSGPLTVSTAVAQTPDRDGVRTYYIATYTSREASDSLAAARKAVYEAAAIGFDKLLTEHTAAWAKLWKKDIIIDGDPEAQQLVHKLMFDLLQSVRPGGADSIAPETLSGNFYKGHIFWDADVWMFPALLAQHPELAKNILDYRFRHLPEARRRAKAQGFAGADFPWESAATGKEVAPGGFSTGRHVTAGVGWAHWQYWLATQDKVWLRERGWPVLSGVADYFASRAKKNPVTGKYDIRRVFGPDELKGMVDNNTYTNALVRYCLMAAGDAARVLGQRANPKWTNVAKNIALPYDKANDRYLAREADDGVKTKQADGELVLYPAALPMPQKTAQNTFDFHAARPIKNGPAMTASIHALLAARLGRQKEAEQYFRDSYRPFVRGPFLLFSEKRSLDRAVFVTGAGGVLQSIVYGFGDLRWDDFDERAKSRRPMALPAAWKKLTITGIQYAGTPYTLTVTPQGRTLSPQ